MWRACGVALLAGVALALSCFCGAARAQNHVAAESWLAAPVPATAPSNKKPEKSPCPPSRTTRSDDGKYAICVVFDYDFHLTPPCSEKRAFYCVKQFVVYDISSASHSYVLGTVALPEKPHGKMRLWHVTDRRAFESGKHRIAITAQGPMPPPAHSTNANSAAPSSPRQTNSTTVASPSSTHPQSAPAAPQKGAAPPKPPESPPVACATWVTIP